MIRYFDIFAGIGGFRSGLEKAGGFKCVGYCEIDKYAKLAYETLYDTEKEVFYDDARKIEPEKLPDFDLICGGFPCQSFSIAGKRGGFDDARGTLFFEIARIAAIKKPKYLLLENVPGLLSHDSGRTFATILSTLDELGYKFMEKDSRVNTSTLNSHILELHETNGRLYTLPTYFTIETLVGQTRYVGDKEGWTLDELISHWEQMPEGSTIEGHTEKDYVYYTILRGMLGSFIDYKNAVSSFDSSEFRKTLEFCNTFDSINDTYSDPDFNAVNFVSSKRFYGFADTHVTLWNAESEPYTFVGYPSDDGCGGFIDTRGNRFAICASTTEEEQQGAWEFIRTYCLDEYQTEHYCQKEKIRIGDEIKEVYSEPVGFPVNLKVYDEIAKDSMNGKYMDSTITMQGDEYEIGQLTQEELDRITDYINRIQNLTAGIDNDLDEIINEEIIAFFNGEISIDECIDYIQNRVEIMVSEKQ